MRRHDLSEARRATAVGLADVSRRYGDVQALTSVSFTLGLGTTVLLGRNGAGKSTLSRILTGLETPSSGSVLRDGAAVTSRADWRHHHSQTGWLPQTLAAPMSMTVEQYLRYAAWLKTVPKAETNTAIDRAIHQVDLDDQRRRRLGQLSGGMLRRAGIAQAIVHDPHLVGLDEPTVGLDPEQRARFHDIIRTLATDRSLLISTHLLEDVEATADRILVLEQGSLSFDGTTDELQAMSSDGEDSSQSRLRSGFINIVSTEGP
jgi:ABC-2 type transport system ATP-binding protein